MHSLCPSKNRLCSLSQPLPLCLCLSQSSVPSKTSLRHRWFCTADHYEPLLIPLASSLSASPAPSPLFALPRPALATTTYRHHRKHGWPIAIVALLVTTTTPPTKTTIGNYWKRPSNILWNLILNISFLNFAKGLPTKTIIGNYWLSQNYKIYTINFW